MIINSALWSLTLMIASIVLAAKVADDKDDESSTDRLCDKIKCDTLHASYVSMSMMHVYYRFLLKTRCYEKFQKSWKTGPPQ